MTEKQLKMLSQETLSKLDQTATNGMIKIQMTNICSACHMTVKTVKPVVSGPVQVIRSNWHQWKKKFNSQNA